jgi:hypothetical protein
LGVAPPPDRLRVRGVILLPLDERLNIARRDQFHVVAGPLHFARPMVGAAAGLYRDEALRMLRHEALELWPRQLLPEENRPVCSAPCSSNTFFARSTPMMLTFFMDALSFLL